MPDHIAFYGTLCSHTDMQQRLGVADRLRLVGPCRIPGRLTQISGYPAIDTASAEAGYEVGGELYEVLDALALETLDEYEDVGHGMYARIRLRLIEPDVEAWVYVKPE